MAHAGSSRILSHQVNFITEHSTTSPDASQKRSTAR